MGRRLRRRWAGERQICRRLRLAGRVGIVGESSAQTSLATLRQRRRRRVQYWERVVASGYRLDRDKTQRQRDGRRVCDVTQS